VQGLGGGCNPEEDCPYVQTYQREPMPNIPGAHYLVREIRDRKTNEIVKREIGALQPSDPVNQKVPDIGTLTSFPYYLVMPGRGTDHLLTMLAGTYPSQPKHMDIPLKEYVALSDVKTARLIIESSKYNR
jgi:hypothetical protein